jgi:Na+-transporting NADH:ubiquinone oxidoreductase subunit F
MSHDAPTLANPPASLDYSLTGVNGIAAIEKGLAEADWYTSPVPREIMLELLERRDAPAIRDTIIWFALLLGSAASAIALWPTAWSILPLILYSVLYASTSDSRWHESGHGTAFRTDWMNNALYEIASFMVMRESNVWRWSHTRHHSDTIIVGRDPEIAIPRPPDLTGILLSFFNLTVYPKYFRGLVAHAFGHMSEVEKTFIPEGEFTKIYFKARITLLIYLGVIILAIALHSILPLLLIGLPNIYGSWLMVVYGLTQHSGLAENVLDHRLNCRTIYMNTLHRYLYWNMNFHVEHHMFPLVPYHALPRLHAVVKDDCPEPYNGLVETYREIIPTVLRQMTDPAYHVKRTLPPPNAHKFPSAVIYTNKSNPDGQGWIEVCESTLLGHKDVIRFDHANKSYALYRTADGSYYASDGFCTHGNTHLSGGLIKDKIIECPKHNGRFNLIDGSPARPPVCRALRTYPIENRGGKLFINIAPKTTAGQEKTHRLRVISNQNVATFIKELVLEPMEHTGKIAFQPGDYLQIDIPTYENIRFREFDIHEPYAQVWETQHVFDLVASNCSPARRNNYSIASNQEVERALRFNIRIATPPPGQNCAPGAGSSYMFNLKAGDIVTGIGPFGDFHVKPTQKEMVYIGGGAGMAPLRSHISHLFETQRTARRVSFWYGARSSQEVFYQEYFEQTARRHPNFRFHVALSAPLPEDNWKGHAGFIHEVVQDAYLKDHENLKAVEFYLCGPPMMIKACTKMLADLGVNPSQVAYDEF